jgi:hypothetical protein
VVLKLKDLSMPKEKIVTLICGNHGILKPQNSSIECVALSSIHDMTSRCL